MTAWYQAHWQALLLFQALWGTLAFAYALERRERFPLRLALSAAAGMLAVELLTRLLWDLGMGWELLTVALLYGILIAVIYLSWKVSFWTAMFMASSGYIAQNIASSLKALFRFTPLGGSMIKTTAGVLLTDLVCYGGIFLLAYFVFQPHTLRGEEAFDNKTKAVFSFVVLLLCAVMGRVIRFEPAHLGRIPHIADRLYQILCSCFILAMQYGVLERADMAHQMDAMRELLHQQKVQYETSKENAQLVNEKYHDLKKMLTNFRGRITDEELDRLEQRIGAYDATVHTGSEVLDVVLAEKRGQALQRGIQTTCYADGGALDFVEELDLYSLLNNALTNAMEACDKLAEEERFVTLTVAREGNMAAIHVENSCEGEPAELKDGLPVTRRDPRYHGFGLKSIARTAEKYGGTIVVKCQDRVFTLDILLFAPERAA